jgi:hypothetical protein
MRTISATRDKSDAGQKQVRIGVYQSDGRVLFVPTGWMWEAHYAATRARLGDKENLSIRELRRRVEKSLGRTLPQWIFGRGDKRNQGGWLRAHEWFFPWLLRGKLMPENVKVVQAAVVERARVAWDYMAHCREAGITISNYSRFFRRGLIPTLGWLKWLYGAAPPDGSFAVPQAILRLRTQTGVKQVIRAAGGNRTVFYLLKKKAGPLVEGLLANPSDYAAGRTPSGPLADSWHGLTDRERAYLVKVAAAATIGACSKRAGVNPTVYAQAMRDADSLGVKDLLLSLVWAPRQKGGTYLKAGLLTPRFFVPSEGMYAFRDAALETGGVWETHLPAFDEWFVDWVTARAMKGKRLTVHLGPPGGPLQQVEDMPSAESRSRQRQHSEHEQEKLPEHVWPMRLEGNSPDRPLYVTLVDMPDAARQEGPIAPNGLRFAGKLHTGFGNLEWRLLRLLWSKPKVSFEEGIQEVYGDNNDNRDEAFVGTIKRLAAQLYRKGLSIDVSQKADYVILIGR